MKSSTTSAFVLFLFVQIFSGHSFSFVLLARRGKGGLKRALNDEPRRRVKNNKNKTKNNKSNNNNPAAVANQGKGQEITGVTLPAAGGIKGWEFGEGVRLVCANVDDRLYALQGDCPRCAFDLWKGDLIANDPGFEDLPRIACPTCSTTYALATGKVGPPLKRKGLQAFVGNLAQTATADAAVKDAQAFRITRDENDGKVYCREL